MLSDDLVWYTNLEVHGENMFQRTQNYFAYGDVVQVFQLLHFAQQVAYFSQVPDVNATVVKGFG